MRKRLLLICLAALFSALTGCKHKEQASAKAVKVKVGHVGHDHHLALYVALDNAAEYADKTGITVKTVEDRKFYELHRNGAKMADIEIVVVGGGAKMPTALAQDVIEVGFGGVAPVLAAVDSGAPVKLISPLHYKGDMFVVRPDSSVKTWADFVKLARESEKPLRIGYKDPAAVAKVVFEEALKHEGLTFSGDVSKSDVDVHMINVKGGGKLNVALSGDLVDGYAGNNPFPAIAVDSGAGRIVCDLEELPPGTFRDHPCCCIAAGTKAIKDKAEAIEALLALFALATNTINNDMDTAVAAACRWLGTSEGVEKMSIPTSGYSMETSEHWHETMYKWIEAMNGLEVFSGQLKGLDPKAVGAIAYDFSLLYKAKAQVGK